VNNDYSKKIGNISGNNFNGNTNFNSDRNIQISNTQSPELMQAYQSLLEEIRQKLEGEIKEQAIENARALQEAIEQNDVQRGKRLISLIRSAIGDVSSLVTIASVFT
jgi:single-stranded DNA-specific DHH superfamily exonuclease